MTIDVEAELERHSEEFLKFDRIENKPSSRPDIHAFILLNQLMPGTTGIVSAGEHDIIYLAVDVEALGEIITTEQVRDLCRCGVIHTDDSLAMYV